MTTTKTRGPSWSDVKESLASLSTSELIRLIASLYGLSKGNRDFLHARFAVGNDPIGPYKKIIDDCMYPDVFKNKPIQISTAKKAISEYSKAIGDAKGEAELMTYFVECGNQFTVDYGDIDERLLRRPASNVRASYQQGPRPSRGRARPISRATQNDHGDLKQNRLGLPRWSL